MKFYSLLVLLCFLQTLICDKAGINQESLKEAFTLSTFYKILSPITLQSYWLYKIY